jgi:hypothetical protein
MRTENLERNFLKFSFAPKNEQKYFYITNTVAWRGKKSEPSTAGTSKLDWMCFEYYQIDRKSS